MELLNLVNAKATLMKQVLILTNGDPKIGDPSAEISRIKAIVSKYSSGKIKVRFCIWVVVDFYGNVLVFIQVLY